MNNGTTERVVGHFNRVALLPDKWDHNQQYQKYMLKQIGGRKSNGLDIGCGTGEFCKSLLSKCEHVIGIDVAPKMIEEALKRNPDNRIDYFVSDVDKFLEGREDSLEVIVSIAAFHHLDYEVILTKCMKALKKGGILIIQDLYSEKTLVFKLLSLLGMLINPFFMLAKNGKLHITREENKIWGNHREDDHYNSIAEIKEMSGVALEKCKIRRHLFWRYTLVYRKL